MSTKIMVGMGMLILVGLIGIILGLLSRMMVGGRNTALLPSAGGALGMAWGFQVFVLSDLSTMLSVSPNVCLVAFMLILTLGLNWGIKFGD